MDLDGTLLNEKSRVSQQTKEYLGELKQNGYIIVIATGRILKSALIATDGADFANYIVTDAGAAVYKKQKRTHRNYPSVSVFAFIISPHYSIILTLVTRSNQKRR